MSIASHEGEATLMVVHIRSQVGVYSKCGVASMNCGVPGESYCGGFGFGWLGKCPLGVDVVYLGSVGSHAHIG